MNYPRLPKKNARERNWNYVWEYIIILPAARFLNRDMNRLKKENATVKKENAAMKQENAAMATRIAELEAQLAQKK